MYLCIRGKTLIINDLKSMYNDMDSKGVRLLRWLLTTKQVTVHGLHAARIVAHLRYYYDIVSNIRDMATAIPKNKIHGIIDLQYHCKQAIKDADLQSLAKSLEIRKLDCIFHSMKEGDLIREAFFCALLAQEYPGDDQVMTIQWHIIALRQSIALKCHTIEELVDVINQHTFTDLEAPQRLRFARLGECDESHCRMLAHFPRGV
jgi:hypothetical protein